MQDGAAGTVQDAVWAQTALLGLVRCSFVLASRRYVHRSLFADLRQVEQDTGLVDDKLLESPAAAVNAVNGHAISLDDLGPADDDDGGRAGQSLLAISSAGNSSTGDSATKEHLGIGIGLPPVKRQSTHQTTHSKGSAGSSAGSASPKPLSLATAATSHYAQLYSKIATAVFCIAFSESCMLFTLLLFGEIVNDRRVV